MSILSKVSVSVMAVSVVMAVSTPGVFGGEKEARAEISRAEAKMELLRDKQIPADARDDFNEAQRKLRQADVEFEDNDDDVAERLAHEVNVLAESISVQMDMAQVKRQRDDLQNDVNVLQSEVNNGRRQTSYDASSWNR